MGGCRVQLAPRVLCQACFWPMSNADKSLVTGQLCPYIFATISHPDSLQTCEEMLLMAVETTPWAVKTFPLGDTLETKIMLFWIRRVCLEMGVLVDLRRPQSYKGRNFHNIFLQGSPEKYWFHRERERERERGGERAFDLPVGAFPHPTCCYK